MQNFCQSSTFVVTTTTIIIIITRITIIIISCKSSILWTSVAKCLYWTPTWRMVSFQLQNLSFSIICVFVCRIYISSTWLVNLPKGSCGWTWCSHSCSFPSGVGCLDTLPSLPASDDLWSWASHRPWRGHSPPCRSYTCSDRKWARDSHCWFHRSGPESSGPRRR